METNVASHLSLSVSARRLCWHGVLLFLLGLVTGVFIPSFMNTRMALSAHLAGVQNGMALLLFGLLWQHLSLSAAQEKIAVWSGISSMYAIWLALGFAALFGTSQATPIAGAGFSSGALQEGFVTTLLYSGSIAILVSVCVILFGLRQTDSSTRSA